LVSVERVGQDNRVREGGRGREGKREDGTDVLATQFLNKTHSTLQTLLDGSN
jgi:hypothetical protein